MSRDAISTPIRNQISASPHGLRRGLREESSLAIPRISVRCLALALLSFFLLLNIAAFAKPTVSLESHAIQELKLRWSEDGHVSRVFGTLRSDVTKHVLLQNPYSSSIQFLRSHADDFGVTDRIHFEHSQTGSRANGGIFVRLKQRHLGVPVEKATAVVAYDQLGNIDYAIAEIDRNVDVHSITPSIEASVAKSLAIEHVRTISPTSSPNVVITGLTLLIYSSEFYRDVEYDRLAWKMVATVSNSASPHSADIFVDAIDGNMLRSVNRFRHGTIKRSVHDATNAENPVQIDWSSEAAIVSEQYPNTTDVEAKKIFDRSKETYDFYSDLGWDGYDSKDSIVYSAAHAGDEFFNGDLQESSVPGDLEAEETPAPTLAGWGPGNGVVGDEDYYPDHMVFSDEMAVKDIVTHEYSHGVIHHSSELEYSGVSGAINESLADVMAVLHDRSNWTVGEDSLLGAVRNIQDPGSLISPLTEEPYPSHVRDYYCAEGPHGPLNDWGGIHHNSSILNHLAYLVIQAIETTNEFAPSGEELSPFDTTAKIYHEIMTVCLAANSDFTDVRDCLMDQAGDYTTWFLPERVDCTFDNEGEDDEDEEDDGVDDDDSGHPPMSFELEVERALNSLGFNTYVEQVPMPCD